MLDFDIQFSPRCKSLRIRVSARQGLVVTAPKSLTCHRVIELVATKSEWIAARLKQFDEVRDVLAEAIPVRPQAFDLPAIGESWRVEYRETRSRTVRARTDCPGRIVVDGAIGDPSACQAALRRWLARRAKEALEPWMARTSDQIGLRYKDFALKSQRTRWGSCTSGGRITLNCKLLFLPREIVRYVMIHELCHTIEPNHSQRFWALVRQFEPAVDSLNGRMRDSWKYLPGWVQLKHEAEL
jgi:hypothetical protein